MAEKKSILFLCTGNSCRSQMAEGFCNHLIGEKFTAGSAGVEKRGLDPLAVTVMQEVGMDISGYQSKTINELTQTGFDFVITVCDNAAEGCPFFPAKTRVIHRGFDDPPTLARKAATDEEKIAIYRRVRDEIKTYVLSLPAIL